MQDPVAAPASSQDGLLLMLGQILEALNHLGREHARGERLQRLVLSKLGVALHELDEIEAELARYPRPSGLTVTPVP